MTGFTPTSEQGQALAGYRAGGHLLIEAAAGTGKTSTLQLLAEADTHRRILYLAYNAVTAQEARGRFPRHVTSVTAHAFAMKSLRTSTDPAVQAVLARLQAPRTPHTQIARQLGIHTLMALGAERRPLQPNAQVGLARRTLTNWCYSADPTLTTAHVPVLEGVDADTAAQVAPTLARYAQMLWADATSPTGQLKTDHDHYLKLFALRGGNWGFDTIMLDEAQDSNAIVVGMLHEQERHGARLIIVGDRRQALYAWRGAVDCMDDFTISRTCQLTRSFRFGQPIADEANKWLAALGTSMRLRGTSRIRSTIGPVPNPDAVLCRTNAGAIETVIAELHAGRKVAVVGGGKDMRSLAEAAQELQTRGQTWHPDLLAFTSWQQVQDYVDHDGGTELATLVKLIDNHGAAAIIAAIDQCVPEAAADVTVSTAHKAKGREWATVRVHSDFPAPDPETDADPATLMLAYVTVTRARERLDVGSLHWIGQYLADRDITVTAPSPYIDAPAADPAQPAAAPAPSADETTPVADLSLPIGPVPADDPWLQPALLPTPADRDEFTVALQGAALRMMREWSAATGTAIPDLISHALNELLAATEADAQMTGRRFYRRTTTSSGQPAGGQQLTPAAS